MSCNLFRWHRNNESKIIWCHSRWHTDIISFYIKNRNTVFNINSSCHMNAFHKHRANMIIKPLLEFCWFNYWNIEWRLERERLCDMMTRPSYIVEWCSKITVFITRTFSIKDDADPVMPMNIIENDTQITIMSKQFWFRNFTSVRWHMSSCCDICLDVSFF